MKAFGFLSFGHYDLGASGPSTPGRTMPGAKENIRNAVEIAVGADEIGVNGAYWRVHHFAPQHAAPHADPRRRSRPHLAHRGRYRRDRPALAHLAVVTLAGETLTCRHVAYAQRRRRCSSGRQCGA